MKKPVSIIVISALIFGCDSKNIEKSPDSIEIKGLSLEQRIADKAQVDNAIEKIENGSKKIKRIIQLVQKLKNKDEQDKYTPVDLIIDINEELKNKIPENREGSLVREGKIEIPIKELSEDCKTLYTTLEAKAIYEDGSIQSTEKTDETKKIIGQQVTYSFKSCGQNSYAPGVTVELVQNELSFKIHKANIVNVFKDLISKHLEEATKCNITSGDSRIIESVTCKNIEAKISSTEVALLKDLNFYASGDVRLEGSADIFEGDQMKATAQIQVLDSGSVKFDMKKIDSTNTLPAQTIN